MGFIIFTDGLVRKVVSDSEIMELVRPLGKMTTIFQSKAYGTWLNHSNLSAINSNTIWSQLMCGCY